MTKFNTLLRAGYTLGVYLVLSHPASAQTDALRPATVLNFVKSTINERSNPAFSVINPTSNYADVQFTYYGLDGNPVSSGLVNPVRYRVAPKGQISMRASELFAGTRADGWVQVTSPTAGLTGFYLSGDFATSLEGSDSASGLTTQVVPVIRDDQSNKTELVLVNPGSSSGSVTVSLYNAAGQTVASSPSQVIAAHAALRLSSSALNVTGAGMLSARIFASVPVAATAIIDRSDSLMFISGQPVDQPATVRIAPHFVTNGPFSEGFDPVLVVANPAASAVQVKVTVFAEPGELASSVSSSRTFSIPANGSIFADIRTITGLPIAPTVNAWLSVESGNIALNGVLILDQGQALTAIALQTAAQDRMIFSPISETQNLATGLVLVNPSSNDAVVDVALVHPDGTTFAQTSLGIASRAKFLRPLRDLLPDALGETTGYIVIHSSTPLFGAGMIAALNNSFLAALPPATVPAAFNPNPPGTRPSFSVIEPGMDVLPGTTLRLSLQNAAYDATFTLSGQALNAQQLGPFGLSYEVTIPTMEPGFANLIVRSHGIDSMPVRLRIVGDNIPTQTINGQAFYQKVDTTNEGLDLSHPVMVPIRHARVEVFSRSSQSVVAVSETDNRGRFGLPVPLDANLTVRVLSRLRSSDLRVADNTNQNQIYAIAADFDGRDGRSELLLTDTSRLSGAFNILEMIERANDFLKLNADFNITLPAPAIYWSTRNWIGDGNINYSQGLIGTTTFNVATNTAVVLGDRNDHGEKSDSDEFDDAVILHEYAHLLAAKFSRDDSPGGPHALGDMLDPRVAWSEGWANFFSSAVRNDPIWRDSRGPNGANILRYDLEDNLPAGDKQPGYWSEASVDTILWDLFDDHADAADDVQYPFAEIWNAFTELRNKRFVYLPYFLENFLAHNPSAADAVRNIVQARSIDFQPNVRPSVVYPFPSPISVGASTSGFVDSVTTKRSNLVGSSHFYSFTTTGGAASIRLDITGLGPGENQSANDLDLFLMDANGRIIDRSDNGLNGQSERIARTLSEGSYVIEIRSFYTRAETGGYVFNSGQYRLSLSVQ